MRKKINRALDQWRQSGRIDSTAPAVIAAAPKAQIITTASPRQSKPQICRASNRPQMAEKQFLTLRHTAVIRLAEAGCEIPKIASITGHTLTTVTQILDRYHVRTKKQAVAAFGKRLTTEG